MVSKENSLNRNSKQKLLIDSVSVHNDNIFTSWLSDVESEPQLSKIVNDSSLNFVSDSKSLLKELVSSASSNAFPNLDPKDIQPFFKLWHKILRDQTSKGITLKALGLSVFSLKKTLSTYMEKEVLDDKSQLVLKQLSRLLDFVGLFTFEIYSAEQENELDQQKNQIEYLQSNFVSSKSLVGNSDIMKHVYKMVGLILDNDITVILDGETGTGKDVIARLIHENSSRKKEPFVVVNCGAIPKDLVESELFGYSKGSFTGADSDKPGKFFLANNGTLFLDEIGELPLDVQVKLLRVLQNKEVESIGSTNKQSINIRVLAATHRNLKQMVQDGTFREDLYYRLFVFPIQIPALRERKDDILPLTHYFIEKYKRQFNLNVTGLSEDASSFLVNYQWPGNIRELENVIQKAIVLSRGGWITKDILSNSRVAGDSEPILLKKTCSSNLSKDETLRSLNDIEKDALKRTLFAMNGNIKKASDILGISRTTFYNKSKKYNISL
ncbi:sigma-54-dependent Fis family transcriptional regulator [bacterium]|jgi:two-component system, NtrC family, response regulator AtoC|nr:sigma-54-dependent Fis family transcriptional regulator [bacterium]